MQLFLFKGEMNDFLVYCNTLQEAMRLLPENLSHFYGDTLQNLEFDTNGYLTVYWQEEGAFEAERDTYTISILPANTGIWFSYFPNEPTRLLLTENKVEHCLNMATTANPYK